MQLSDPAAYTIKSTQIIQDRKRYRTSMNLKGHNTQEACITCIKSLIKTSMQFSLPQKGYNSLKKRIS